MDDKKKMFNDEEVEEVIEVTEEMYDELTNGKGEDEECQIVV